MSPYRLSDGRHLPPCAGIMPRRHSPSFRPERHICEHLYHTMSDRFVCPWLIINPTRGNEQELYRDCFPRSSRHWLAIFPQRQVEIGKVLDHHLRFYRGGLRCTTPTTYFLVHGLTVFVVTLSGCRHGFQPIATTKVKLHIQEATAGREGGVITTCIDISYDPQLANGGDGGATSESWRNVERQAVVKNGGDRSTTQSRVDERLPLSLRPLKPSTQVIELEGGEIHSVKEAGSGEDRGDERKIALFQECLLPFKLLEKQRVRRVLFVDALFSVRRVFLTVCCIWYSV